MMMDPDSTEQPPEPIEPMEAKVKAATAAAAIAGLVVWVLQTWVFGGSVPGPVEAAVNVLVPAGAAAVAGWRAPHTPRDGGQEE